MRRAHHRSIILAAGLAWLCAGTAGVGPVCRHATGHAGATPAEALGTHGAPMHDRMVSDAEPADGHGAHSKSRRPRCDCTGGVCCAPTVATPRIEADGLVPDKLPATPLALAVPPHVPPARPCIFPVPLPQPPPPRV